ncbi:PVC-type heme-binding CxxCH protein [Algoriphagus sp. C2-6-M1]|uniref:PVC-type heme-binding CxxCH protein n=1 Tax=Algoriphagus persicinus TaxID=3108754 RepID=UPI002B3A8842|nr:PVC-type heme-binding CxxCH protein [Algoriphagus sp. C2-6-M1]MEB2780676.1 PVC-type heme-binding CxxCH protein [Algoriphagus sp. C2-6-M1]
MSTVFLKLRKNTRFLFFLIPAFLFFSCKKNASPDQNSLSGITVLDPRLELSLAVEDPAIVTPIGIAIDDQDRVYVLESHTHLPPKEYSGPDGDLIKVFQDTNGDGTLDSVGVFAGEIDEGMNLAFSPEGDLYLVTSKAVWVFYDHDKDGVAEERKKLLELIKPDEVYAHAALLSITFSSDGWMYVGRGNTGSDLWIMQGSDGSEVTGFGDGGNIIRARNDGSEVAIFSTGYWNPFDLKFDTYGRLLVADNDPDSRGPNRLLHAVQGSDFGYKSLFGGSGIHPYSAWNAELPGTLPYAVALGEAPSGLINANLAKLPEDYKDQMLATIWEESSIVRVRFKVKGWSVSGQTEVVVQGGEDFRPIAFAADSKGNIYFTDWVIRFYPNHGKGRIWKLSAKKDEKVLERTKIYQTPEIGNSFEKSDLSLVSYEVIKDHLVSDDPFEAHAALMILEKDNERIKSAAKDSIASVRLAALLAAMKTKDKSLEYLVGDFIKDEDLRIRKMALIWVGSAQLTQYENQLETALTSGEVDNDLFETYLETVKLIQPQFVKAFQNQEITRSKSLPRELPADFISQFIQDSTKPADIKVFAFRYLKDLTLHKDFLLSFLEKDQETQIRQETIWTVQGLPDKDVAANLLKVALDIENPEIIRSDALAVLESQPLENWESIISLLDDREENVRIEAARYLRSKISSPEVKVAFESRRSETSDQDAFQEQLILTLDQKMAGRPNNDEEKLWNELIQGQGDPERGRRVFFSNTSLCSSCHQNDGRGGDIGPDLSQVGKSKEQKGLISSILKPSAEMSPEWQGWYIKLLDGSLVQGRQIDVGNDQIVLYTQAKGFISVYKKEIDEYGMVKESLMPEGLEERLSNQDLRDLLAYLSRMGGY